MKTVILTPETIDKFIEDTTERIVNQPKISNMWLFRDMELARTELKESHLGKQLDNSVILALELVDHVAMYQLLVTLRQYEKSCQEKS